MKRICWLVFLLALIGPLAAWATLLEYRNDAIAFRLSVDATGISYFGSQGGISISVNRCNSSQIRPFIQKIETTYAKFPRITASKRDNFIIINGEARKITMITAKENRFFDRIPGQMLSLKAYEAQECSSQK